MDNDDDGDGIPDHLDDDADGDGIADDQDEDGIQELLLYLIYDLNFCKSNTCLKVNDKYL